MSAKRKAALELVICANIWGFGFIATVWILQIMGPLWSTVVRFCLSGLVVLVPMVLLQAIKKSGSVFKTQGTLSIIPGIFLSLAIFFQSFGLLYTTTTKCSFITTLYVLGVPFFEVYFLKKKIHYLHGLFVALAILGAALICQINSETSLEGAKGDFYTLIGAFFASLQIVWITKIKDKIQKPFLFNALQSWWAGVFAIPLSLLLEGTNFFTKNVGTITPKEFLFAGLGFVFLIFFSTLLGFFMQIRNQKILSASTTSMIILLESPFAALWAWIMLQETTTALQWIGGILILVASAGAVSMETKLTKRRPV